MTGWNPNELGRDRRRARRELGGNDGLDVVNADKDVLGLEVGVDDVALLVEVVESEENLLGDLLDNVRGDAPMLVPLDEAQQVLAEDLKDHADVRTVRANVPKVIE